MHLILTGATGLVGTGVLDAMLRTPSITKITVLSRRPVPLATNANDPRVNMIIHDNFLKYDDALLGQLEDAKGCVWALGISQTQVSKEDYVIITNDYVMEAAKRLATLVGNRKDDEEPFRFVYVSGEGATWTPKAHTSLFGRVKGQTERQLADMTASIPGFRTYSVRPGWVDSSKHASIQQHIPNRGMLFGAMETVLGPVIRTGFKGSHSPTKALGEFLTGLSTGSFDGRLQGEAVEQKPGGGWIIGNVAIRRLMNL